MSEAVMLRSMTAAQPTSVANGAARVTGHEARNGKRYTG
jgi:hypothetical protein